MALFKKAEFAAECGVKTAYISVMLKRGKVVETPEGQIDSLNVTNAAFMEHQKELHLKKQAGSEVKETAPKQAKKAKPTKSHTVVADPEIKKRLNDKFSVEMDEKKARTQKIAREMQLMDMKTQKLMGQLIPTDLVASTIRQLMQSALVSFTNSADALAVDLSKKFKIDRAQLADFRKSLKRIANEAVNHAVNDAQKNIRNIAQEHSQTDKTIAA
jgi:hypothetical protein